MPPRTRLNNRSEDPPPAMPVADAAENEENDPDDSALSPGVPTLVEPCPEELWSKLIPNVDCLVEDGILGCWVCWPGNPLGNPPLPPLENRCAIPGAAETADEDDTADVGVSLPPPKVIITNKKFYRYQDLTI